MIKAREIAAGLALLSASCCVCVALLEAAARIASPMPVFGPWFDLRPKQTLVLEPRLHGVASPARHTTNRWGLRGDEPPKDWDGSYTLVTLGGSTTQCFYLDDALTWPHRLQANLRAWRPDAWVGNAGVDGATSHGHVLMMEKVVAKLRPDMVVILAGVNDLGLSLSTERARSGSPYDKRFRERFQAAGWRAFLLGHSRLAQLAYLWRRILVEKTAVVGRTAESNLIVSPLRGPEDVPADTLAILPSLPAYLANIDSIIALARGLGVRPIFLTQPSLYRDEPRWRGVQSWTDSIRGDLRRVSAATEWRLLDRFNRGLLERCRARGADCFDLAGALPPDSALFYDAYHFNDSGAALVAKKLAGYLRAVIPGGTEAKP
jgi:lysophospholipase L1-like esterase